MTSGAGLPKDFSSPREFLSRELRAASASAITGSAAYGHCKEEVMAWFDSKTGFDQI
jgi:hypothetical protein